MKPIFAPLSLLAALAACATGVDRLTPANQIDSAAQLELKGAASPDPAIATWERAIGTLQPGSEDYFGDQLYIARARYATNEALAELLWDRPAEARQRYIDVLAKLQADVTQHEAQAQAVNDRVQTFGAVASIASSVAGEIFAGQAGAGAGGAQVLDASKRLSDSIASLASLDWGGVEDIHQQGLGALEVDFVRMPFFAHFHELASIGRLTASDGQSTIFCTASLVGERLALTNAHCVHDHGRLRSPSELRLNFDKLVGQRRADSAAGSWVSESIGVARIEVSPSYLDGQQSVVECGHDWAILELDRQPAGLDHFEVLDGLTFRSTPVPGVYRGNELVGDRLVVAGYSGDLNQGRLITMDYGCPILSKGDAIEYRCATFHGASGSPILLANGPYRLTHVVGVNACSSGQKTEQSWRTYRSRDDLIGTAMGTPSESFIAPLLRLRGATGTNYAPSSLGAQVPLAGKRLNS